MQPPQQRPSPSARPPLSPTLRWTLVGLLIAAIVVALEWNTISSAVQRARAGITSTTPAAGMTTHAAISAPALGGRTDDFLRSSAYQPISGSRGLEYRATVAGQPVDVLLMLDHPGDSLDGVAHVMVITVQVPSDQLGTVTWSPTTADTIAQSFLPSDAQFQRIATLGAIRDHIYTSAQMAATFTADLFTNDSGTTHVPVGTVSYSCQGLRDASPAAISGCVIAIGSY